MTTESFDPDIITYDLFFRYAFQELMKDIHTMLPGVVDSFDPATQQVRVKIAMQQLMQDDQLLPYPTLVSVPLMVYRAGGYSVTLPVKKGDTVAVFFSERSLTLFIQYGKTESAPNESRFFDLADGYAIPGIFPKTNALSGYNSDVLEIRSDDGSVKIKIDADNSEIFFDNGTATFSLKNGKLTIDNGTAEVVDLVSQILQQLSTETVIIPSGSSAGTYNLTGQAVYSAIKALWDTFK